VEANTKPAINVIVHPGTLKNDCGMKSIYFLELSFVPS